MNSIVYENLKVIWDYMHMNMVMDKADCIVGFGNYNDEIALRAAELYKLNYSSKILFTGGLGRNTSDLWVQSEAERFSKIGSEPHLEVKDLVEETKMAYDYLQTRFAGQVAFSFKSVSSPVYVKINPTLQSFFLYNLF